MSWEHQRPELAATPLSGFGTPYRPSAPATYSIAERIRSPSFVRCCGARPRPCREQELGRVVLPPQDGHQGLAFLAGCPSTVGHAGPGLTPPTRVLSRHGGRDSPPGRR